MTPTLDTTTTTPADYVGEFQRALGIPTGTPLPPPRSEEMDRELTRALLKQNRIATFSRLCTQEFRQKIDPDRLPNPVAWAAADRWSGEHPGLWLWGHTTGECKTRMLWRKFGQLHVERGLSIARLTGVNLAESYHDYFNRSRTADFYAQFHRIDVVMLDDLDKLALPDPTAPFGQQDQGLRNGRMVRELFDRFYEHRQPVLVTANEPIAFFGARIGPSAERRMREVCREIEF